MITKISIDYGFEQAFSRAVQTYGKNIRSQSQAIYLPPEQTIRGSWNKMHERLAADAASASEALV